MGLPFKQKLKLSVGFTVFLHFSVDQVIRKGEVSCCWICTACKDNEYVQDEFTCKACELGWWPDKELEGRFTCLMFSYLDLDKQMETGWQMTTYKMPPKKT